MRLRASLIAYLVKDLPSMQETRFDSWVGKIHWRMDRLPTPVFLGFPSGLAGKESACNEGDLGLIPGLSKPWRMERLPTPIFWPGEFHGLSSPWGCKELDTTEWLSLSLYHVPVLNWNVLWIYNILFIGWWCLDYFHLLTIINYDTMNIGMQVFYDDIFSFPLSV